MEKTLLSFGHGYSAQALAATLIPQGWKIFGTTRNPEKAQKYSDQGVQALLLPDDDLGPVLEQCSAVLVSAGPDADGDPMLAAYEHLLRQHAKRFSWVGYLSTTGVYGDHQGGWVDETTPLTPSTRRGQWRKQAEQAWQGIPDLPLHIFRLAGIYGPGRGPFTKVRQGAARRIIKENQIFSRIHVADIAQCLAASLGQPNPGAIYNLCDDDPVPPEDVIEHAAWLLGLPVPPSIPIEQAEMTPMARSFYAESKRVRNTRIKQELGIKLLYPSYRDGLSALLAEANE